MVGLVCLVYLASARSSSVSCRTWRWCLLPCCCAGDGWMSRQVSASTSCSWMQCWSFSVFQLGKFGQYVLMKCPSSIRLIHIWRVLIVWPAGCCQEGRWSWRMALAGEPFLPILFRYLKIFLACWWFSCLSEKCEMCWNLSLFWFWYLAHMSNRMFHPGNAIFWIWCWMLFDGTVGSLKWLLGQIFIPDVAMYEKRLLSGVFVSDL
jgi:hypothetical protein